MTESTLRKYLSAQGKLTGLSGADATEYINTCIEFGLNDFWNAYPWSFRMSEKELDTSSEAESYEAPWSDFAGFGTVREKTSLAGNDLRYMPKEDFDSAYPRPLSHASGYPKIFTVYKNKDTGKWYFKFYPVPSVSKIYVEVCSSDAPNVNAVPDGFCGGLRAAVVKYLYPTGSPEGVAASRAYDRELWRLRIIDSPMKSRITHILDDTDTTTSVWRPWL